jgi:hypothetical protein
VTTVAAGREDGSAEPSSEATASPASPPNAPGSRDVEQPQAGGATKPVEFEAATALPQVLKIVGSVVAPSTLLTALLFYFGLMYAIGFYRYFGVNFTVLNLPFQDYLVLSSDSSIIPLIYLAGATLLALGLYQLRVETLPARARAIILLVLMPSATIAGLALVSMAMAHTIFGAHVFPATFLEARGLSLSIGVLLLAYASRLRRTRETERRPGQAPRRLPETVVVARWGAVFILVSIGLFWAVGSYAVGVGMRSAQELAAALSSRPDVVLYTEKSQSLQAPGVQEVICQNHEAAYRFRYEGLKLVPQSGDHYLFLPAGWTPAGGAAILIPRDEKMRLEFSSPGQLRSASC